MAWVVPSFPNSKYRGIPVHCAVCTFDERVHRHLVAVLGRLELHVDVDERLRRSQVLPDGRHVPSEWRVLITCTSEFFRRGRRARLVSNYTCIRSSSSSNRHTPRPFVPCTTAAKAWLQEHTDYIRCPKNASHFVCYNFDTHELFCVRSMQERCPTVAFPGSVVTQER